MTDLVETMHLFTGASNRECALLNLLQLHFEQVSPQHILYELKRYGLALQHESIPFDPQWWTLLHDWGAFLQSEWDGPDTSVYILPAQKVNAVCFQRCICLFACEPLENDTLYALLTHEYNHSCRLKHFGLPKSVEDYIVLEGLAQWAVRMYHGEEALQPWSKALSYEEVFDIWQQVDLDSIIDVYALLFGDEAAFIPSHFGYSFGYRLIEDYVTRHDCTMKELLRVETAQFWPK